MNNNSFFYLIHILGASLVLGSYFYFLPKVPTKTAWAGIEGKLQTVYTISILLSAIAYIYFFVTVVTNDKITANLNFWCGLFLLSASLWAPSMYFFPENKILTVLILTLTSISVFSLLYSNIENTSRFSLISLSYLLLHVFLLDNVVWSLKYVRI
jgi:hypothetical protein